MKLSELDATLKRARDAGYADGRADCLAQVKCMLSVMLPTIPEGVVRELARMSLSEEMVRYLDDLTEAVDGISYEIRAIERAEKPRQFFEKQRRSYEEMKASMAKVAALLADIKSGGIKAKGGDS